MMSKARKLTRLVSKCQKRGESRRTPVQAVNASITIALFVGRDAIPLLDKDLEVLSNVRLKLENRLGSKGVRNNLSLARMLSSVACVEKTTTDRHKGIIEVSVF